ncbi:hypothetical protein H4P1_00037 (plasmid) [Variovorax sp. PBS-H4]|uniref:hypothetical protein n=1 Tax=Variovorax sp. PBS-H4 TaxID=434008 RepID=UPI0013181B82|nr:hypothetical protein [Variovorax sp. PBS-H4]VTU41405.1 hypothetical protein H4P1_00037 [Variovorax sp. PBS-H4]
MTSVTTWNSPFLPAGVLNTPFPTILIDIWQLTARVHLPRKGGFRHIRNDRRWSKARRVPTLCAIVQDDSLFIGSSEQPLPADRHEWATDNLVAWFFVNRGWVLPLDRLRADDQFFLDATAAQQILIVTAPLRRYWEITTQGVEVTFDALRERRNWAARAMFHPC